MESLEEVIIKTLEPVPDSYKENVISIGIDTTGSTLGPVDKDGIMLSLKKEFLDNPNAMFILWKDHTAVVETEHISMVAKSWYMADSTHMKDNTGYG